MEKMRKVKKLSEGQQLMKLSRDREAKKTYRERRKAAGLSEVTVWVTEEQRKVVLGWQAVNLERVVKGEAVDDEGWWDGSDDGVAPSVPSKGKVPREEWE
jgi:hypothetical protein